MLHLPKITIITPSFNQGDYLERTICSVLDQKYPHLEYFVIDGGSTDQSVEIIRRYQHHLSGWISERDHGQTDAINKGLGLASGDIIAYLNSDDLYLPNTFEQVAKAFTHDDKTQWIVGGCRQIDTTDQVIGEFDHHLPTSFASYLMRLDGLLLQPSSFWSAKLFKKCGFFDTNLHYSFDYEFNCRLLSNDYVPTLLDAPLADFRIHDASKGISSPIRFGLERIEIAKLYANYLPNFQRWQLMRNIGYRQRQYAIQEASFGKPLWKQVANHPWWLASSEIRLALLTSKEKAA